MTSQANSQPVIWCDKHEASRILSLSKDTLKRLRLSNQLIEGIHWVRFSSRCIRYNVKLLQDWAATRTDAGQHERAIDNYLSSLPSNQPKTRGRRRKC